MKKILLLLILVGIAATASAQVNFVDVSTDRLHKMALEQQKLVFVDLYATWCPPCRAMDKDVFSREDVGEFMNANFVNAKYSVDEYTGKKLATDYGANGIPTYLIFNDKGELQGRMSGGSSAANFLAGIRKIIAGKQPKK